MPRLLLILLLFISSARACYWDRDTLQEEAKGQLDVVKAAIGWFDRYPPHYYEMRLERVSKSLGAILCFVVSRVKRRRRRILLAGA